MLQTSCWRRAPWNWRSWRTGFCKEVLATLCYIKIQVWYEYEEWFAFSKNIFCYSVSDADGWHTFTLWRGHFVIGVVISESSECSRNGVGSLKETSTSTASTKADEMPRILGRLTPRSTSSKSPSSFPALNRLACTLKVLKGIPDRIHKAITIWQVSSQSMIGWEHVGGDCCTDEIWWDSILLYFFWLPNFLGRINGYEAPELAEQGSTCRSRSQKSRTPRMPSKQRLREVSHQNFIRHHWPPLCTAGSCCSNLSVYRIPDRIFP